MDIPDYAHPVPVGADGIKFRRVHGPRTLESTQLRERARAEATRITKERDENDPFHNKF